MQAVNPSMDWSKENMYYVMPKVRVGQYELTTTDTGALCLFMDDTNKYEYFPKDTVLIQCDMVNNVIEMGMDPSISLPKRYFTNPTGPNTKEKLLVRVLIRIITWLKKS